MTKLITAKDILKQKGLEPTKFNTNAFMEEVARFFIDHPPRERLLLFPVRFAGIQIDTKNDPCTIISSAELSKLTPKEIAEFDELDKIYNRGFYSNPFFLTWRQRLQGFKNETITNKRGELLYVRELRHASYYYDSGGECADFIRRQEKFSLLRPRFLVDRPFIKNAAATLRIMGGYVVEPFRHASVTYYNVTLI